MKILILYNLSAFETVSQLKLNTGYSKLTLIHYQPKLELFALSGWINNFSKFNWVLISGIINVNLNGCFIFGLNPLPLVHKQSYNYFLSYTHIGIFVLPVIRLKQGFPMYIFQDPKYMYIVSTRNTNYLACDLLVQFKI